MYGVILPLAWYQEVNTVELLYPTKAHTPYLPGNHRRTSLQQARTPQSIRRYVPGKRAQQLKQFSHD